jgi:hypothetical protein
MTHLRVRLLTSVARLLKACILSTAISLESKIVHNISMNEKREIKRIADPAVSLKKSTCNGIITVTYAQVKARRRVLIKPAFRRNNNDLNGHKGRLYSNVNNTAIVT